MALQPQLSELSKFLLSVLAPKQINELIPLLKQGIEQAGGGLDPEANARAKQAAAQAVPVQNTQAIQGLLNEIEAAYSVTRFPNPNQEILDRIKSQYPEIIPQISAFQGRHLVTMLRERLK